MIKNLMSILILTLCLSHCTEFAMLTSTTGLAVSHNTYAKLYNGIDFLTIINTEKDSFEIDFSQWQVEKLNKKRGKAQNSNSLTLSTTENIVKCILLKDIHFDNICISCSLSWSRVPNVFNKSLYEALNFFHI